MARKRSKSQVLKEKITNKKTSTNRSTKNAPRIAYQYGVEMHITTPSGEFDVDRQFIKYIVFDYDYENYTMPVIYVGFSATKDVYNALMTFEAQKAGKVFFNLYRNDAYASTALNIRTVSGEFSFIPSTDNLNYVEELDDATTADNSYKTITIALMSEDLMNRSKSYVNRIFTETSTNNLLAVALEGLSEVSTVIMKCPQYSVDLSNQIIPPMTNREQLIEYIFNEAPFYDTNFTFFLDFDRTYLLDRSGEGARIEDNTLHTVIFDITQATNSSSYYEGLEVRESEGAYIVNINPADAKASLNRSQDRVANRLVVVNEDGYNEEMDVPLEVNTTAYSSDKLSFKRGVDAKLIKNNMESNTLFFTVQKSYIDANIFTPNKKYMVSNYAKGADYNGTYTLSYKREVIVNSAGTFNESSEFGLRKVGNIESTGGLGAANASNNSKRPEGYYSNSGGSSGSTNPNTASRTNTNGSSSSGSNSTGTNSGTQNAPKTAKGFVPLQNAAGPKVILHESPRYRTLMRD